MLVSMMAIPTIPWGIGTSRICWKSRQAGKCIVALDAGRKDTLVSSVLKTRIRLNATIAWKVITVTCANLRYFATDVDKQTISSMNAILKLSSSARGAKGMDILDKIVELWSLKGEEKTSLFSLSNTTWPRSIKETCRG